MGGHLLIMPKAVLAGFSPFGILRASVCSAAW